MTTHLLPVQFTGRDILAFARSFPASYLRLRYDSRRAASTRCRLGQGQAIDYATCRPCFRAGEIRILKSNGTVERTISFNETGRRL